MLWEGEECRAKLKFEVEQSRSLWDVLDMLSFWVFLFKKYYTSIPIGAFLLSLTLFSCQLPCLSESFHYQYEHRS
jgi:hypothetical protein